MAVATSRRVKKAETPQAIISVADEALIEKVIPVFNVMQSQSLSVDDGLTFLSLLRMMKEKAEKAPLKAVPSSKPVLKRFDAIPGKTAVTEMVRLHASRPFIYVINDIEILIEKDMDFTTAARAVMKAQMEAEQRPATAKAAAQPLTTPAIPEPAPEPAPVAIAPKKPLKAVKPKKATPAPGSFAQALESALKGDVLTDSDIDEDDDAQPPLPEITAYPKEALPELITRAYKQRPVIAIYGEHRIVIDEYVTLVDAQINAADQIGINGNMAKMMEELNVDPVKLEKMFSCPVDDAIFGVSTNRYGDAEIIRTSDCCWLEGYPFRIACTPFDEFVGKEVAFWVHFRSRPEQAIFEVYYQLYRNHTHKVHVRHRKTAALTSDLITDQYCSWRPKSGSFGHAGASVMDNLGLHATWEPEARYRIRYWNRDFNKIDHMYFRHKPQDYTVKSLNHPQHKAMVQTRPSGV